MDRPDRPGSDLVRCAVAEAVGTGLLVATVVGSGILARQLSPDRCGDTCPYVPGQRYLDWQLDDPHGQGLEAVRPIRDEIERRVRKLLAELGVPVPPGA